jgi:hypothetical protein
MKTFHKIMTHLSTLIGVIIFLSIIFFLGCVSLDIITGSCTIKLQQFAITCSIGAFISIPIIAFMIDVTGFKENIETKLTTNK